MAPGDDRVHQTAEAVARDSYGKLIAFLVARTGDIAGAEDALSDAFATALAEWPKTGIPDNPRAWLMTVARRKRLDQFRRAAPAGMRLTISLCWPMNWMPRAARPTPSRTNASA